MRTVFLSLLILTNFLIATYAPPSFGADLPRFTTETAAQQHCLNDEVVWLNTNSGIWHSQGGRWYGRTKSGVYVCKKEAVAAGNRGSLNE
jgi:hypothetical protein